ncbi:MAG: hypothetical protein ACT4OS_06320 [Acidimicrobiales bacterium]
MAPRPRQIAMIAAGLIAALSIGAVIALWVTGNRGPDSGEQPTDGGPAATTTTTIPLNPVQKAINARCRKGGVVELTGTFAIEHPVSIEGCQKLTLRGPLVIDGSKPGRARENRHVSIRNSTDIVIEDVTVLGGRCRRPCENTSGGLAKNERQHGFEVAASDRVELRRVQAVNVWGDGVYVTAKTFEGGIDRAPTDIRVVDSWIDNTGRQGIAVAGVVGMVVEGTSIRLANRTVLDFEAESGGARDFSFIDGHIIEPDNATLNVSCKADAGEMLNRGPFLISGTRVYGDRLKVNPFNCDLPPGMVIEENNTDDLPLDQAPLRPGQDRV